MEENDQATVEGFAESNSKKRPRKKYLYSQILQQMEFYFSDANLARDRFLGQLLKESKNIPLDVFLKFNKIRHLTSSTEEIAKALGTSELLKVTEDGKHVYRTKAVQRKENEDDCTIYVEQLPPDANHEWVRGIFSSYGNVEYVSIPKFKTRAAIKGFAFVEFDTPEAAKQALEAFGSAGCCIPQQMPPEELCSVATFESENGEVINTKNKPEVAEKQLKNIKKMKGESTEETTDFELMQEENFEGEEVEFEEPKSKKLKTEFDEPQMGKKQKKKNKIDKNNDSEYAVTENEAAETVITKKSMKRKLENENVESVNVPKSCYNEEGSDNDAVAIKKKKKKVQEEAVDDVTDLTEETAESETLSKVKRKKKKKQKFGEDGSGEVETDPEDIEEETGVHQNVQLRKKKSKKKPRNDESEDDRDRIAEDAEDEGTSETAKKQTKEDGFEDEDAGADSEKSRKKLRGKRNKHSKKKNTEKKDNDPASLGLQILSKKEWRRLRNKYLNLQREKIHALKKHLARSKSSNNYQSPYPAKDNQPPELKEESITKSKKTTYTPGVIVHIDLGEPLEDLTSFKNSARTEPGVEYVDATLGSSEAYIRCISSEAAQKLVDKSQWDNMEILEGEADNEYWKKIFADRETKIKQDKHVPKSRGRNKILKRAERELGKHIKFDD